MDARHHFGATAERVAARFLQKSGYEIVARNVRSRYGELDLVAREGDVLVFCEVKARRSGDPGEAIDAMKQHKLIRLAEMWLQKNNAMADMACRFDAVLMQRKGVLWNIELVRDAFRPGW
ncbi:MAG: YraN family protein [Magnetococcales bacterium]|nr:YraN family protein [Magnetococcales bacterium]